MAPHINPICEVAVLEDTQDFANLKEEWEDLYQNSPLATPFQSWAWLYSWWESYGDDYELHLITVRVEGLLVGLIPLMLDVRWGFFSRALFIGTGLTDYNDILVRGGWEKEVLEAGRHLLWQAGPWQVADLQELRPEAAAWSVLRQWPASQTRMRQSSCPVIEAKPWDELLVSLSTNLRSTARRALRRANEDGVFCELASAEDAEEAARRWVALHREVWRGRDLHPEHSTERFERHMVASAKRLTACGLGGLSEFWHDGEVVATHLLLFGRDFVGQHLFGARQEVLRRYQLSSLIIWDALNIARNRGDARVNLLRGEESYKLRWTSESIANHRVILSRNLSFRSLYVLLLSLRRLFSVLWSGSR